MAELKETEKSYGIMERLLFYTLPVLFTLLLTGVLLTVFGYDVMNEVLRVANKIPVVSSAIPDPKPSEEELREAIRQAQERQGQEERAPEEERMAALQASVSEKDAQISALMAENKQKTEQIAELEAEVEAAQAERAKQTISDEEYAQNIRNLANVYSNMSPGKAGPVMESLTLSERVLVLREMEAEAQVDILEKMDPEIAAETSILMKDLVSAKDLQIAALQERLALSGEGGAENLTRDEVSRTFSQMTPELAAEVLLEMYANDQTQVITILRLMEEASRASVLNAMAEISKEETAKISGRLGE